MKKFFAIAIAAVAVAFASCGSKTNSDPDAIASDPKAAAEQVVTLLQEQIKNADAEQIKAIGQTVSEKVAEFIAKGDNEAAQTYAGIISKFIDNNAEKLKEIGASATLSEALSAVVALPTNSAEAAQAAADAAAGLAADQAEAAKDAAATAVSDAKQAVEDATKAQVDAAKAAAEAQAAAAKAAADAKVQEGRDAANKAIDDAAAAAKKQLGL